MSNNDSQPDPTANSTLSTEERRTIAPDLILDSSLALEKYKLPVIAGVLLLVLGLVGSEFYQNSQAKTAAAASALLDAAKTEPDYQKVIDTYPGSPAAANAYLLLGRVRADAKNYAGAAKAWQAFAENFPQHSLVPNALIGQASALEALNKPDEALALYQRVATSYQNSSAAPLARIGEADLLLAQRKTQEAKNAYEDVIANFPKSFARRVAEENLTMLNVLPPLGGTPPAVAAPMPPAVEIATSVAPSSAPAVTAPVPVPSASPSSAEPVAPAATVAPIPTAVPSASPVATP